MITASETYVKYNKNSTVMCQSSSRRGKMGRVEKYLKKLWLKTDQF